MTDERVPATPVWLVAAESTSRDLEVGVPDLAGEMTAQRLEQLRNALAMFLDKPLVTVEAYPVPADSVPSGGRILDAASPLARHLSDLVRNASPTASSPAAAGGEVLYRMVVPPSVAAQLGQGIVRSMPSKAVEEGIHSSILGAKGVVANATFVRATGSAAKPTGTAAVGATAAAGGGLVAVAGPLVILALATAASIHAEEQRRQAIERVTDLLKGLHQSQLEAERDRLTGCEQAIQKATAVLLDGGEIGHSLGLDSAVNTIDTAVATALRRANDWHKRLAPLASAGATTSELKKAFPGIEHETGEFRVQLRIAALAIALKRRVAVLQAVDHAQRSPDTAFQRFTQMLRSEQESVDDLEAHLKSLLDGVAELRVRPPTGFIDKVMTRGEVNELLRWPVRLRALAANELPTGAADNHQLEVTMIKQRDGRLKVLPMRAVNIDRTE